MSRQAVKYQETTVEAFKSVSEIADLIRRYGGTRFEQVWGEDGRILAVRFAMRHPEIGEVPVALTVKTTQVKRILLESSYLKSYSPEQRRERIQRQAERIAWRHTKDLTEQLLLSVELGLRSLPAAFLADLEAYDEIAGETVTMGELIERRAALSASGRGVELTATNKPGEVLELPPARDEE